MIKPEQIPHSAMNALLLALRQRRGGKEAIAAALSAWPGMKLENLCGWVMDGPDLPYVEEAASLILPLPTQENGDD